MTDINKTIGANIKALREKKKLTHQQVYSYLKCSRAMYAKIEHGSASITPLRVIQLCDLFKCTPNILFKGAKLTE